MKKRIKRRGWILSFASLAPIVINTIVNFVFDIDFESNKYDWVGWMVIAYYIIMCVIYFIIDRCPYCRVYLGTRNHRRCPGCGKVFR